MRGFCKFLESDARPFLRFAVQGRSCEPQTPTHSFPGAAGGPKLVSPQDHEGIQERAEVEFARDTSAEFLRKRDGGASKDGGQLCHAANWQAGRRAKAVCQRGSRPAKWRSDSGSPPDR